jgi:lysozyme
MKTSPAGLALIKVYESCRLKAYLDTGKPPVPTIGWGHTKGVKLGDKCTQAQADAWLVEDMASAERDIARLVTVPLEQHQFDALVSFVYNLGGTNFATSTLLRKVNARDYAGAAGQFGRWIYDDGVIQNGLVLRRADERSLFLNY